MFTKKVKNNIFFKIKAILTQNSHFRNNFWIRSLYVTKQIEDWFPINQNHKVSVAKSNRLLKVVSDQAVTRTHMGRNLSTYQLLGHRWSSAGTINLNMS